MSDNFKKVELKGFRYYQEEADNAIYEELLINNKCIVKMFCGTGKSLLMRKCKSAQNQKLVVYVFPSLSLIDQFCRDYFVKVGLSPPFKISSENGSTTDSTQIKAELKRKKNKIICITYQSYNTLLDNLGSIKIDVCIYDEAHHAVGETYQKLIFERNDCEKQIFFTATPKDDNGIVMCDKEIGICGRTVYDYSYLRGLADGYLNPFEIRVDMYTENTNKSVYESIARAILESGNNRVLTFHADVNTDRDTSVRKFINENEFVRAFMKVLTEEFPKKAGLYTTFKMIGLYSTIEPERRKILLNELDMTADNSVYIISSCETIGEGIDTKNANMCVFVDPKSSFVKIIQNIGRIVRPQSKPSTVLIPCWVDREKYVGCDENRDKCDEVIRSDLNKDGNFNGILNVLSALRQEDEDLYDACLNYGKDVDDKSNYSSSTDDSDSEDEYSENSGSEYNDSDDEMDVKLKHKINISFHTNDEIKVLWKITSDIDIMKNMRSCVLECEVDVVDNWFERFEELKKFIDENEIRPKSSQIKDIYELRLGEWCSTQIKRYKKKSAGMKNETRYNLWAEFVEEYKEYFIDNEEKWIDTLDKLKTFIDENKRRPNLSSNNNNEKLMARWFINNTMNYKNKNKGMLSETRYSIWSQFKEEYKEYFIDDEEKWIDTLDKLKTFIDENKRKPIPLDRHKSKNTEYSEENKLGEWVSGNQKCFNNKTFGMKNISRYNLWNTFLCDYSTYYKKNDDKWIEQFNNLKYFFDTNKKRPNKDGNDLTEKKLGQWMTNQIKNHKNKLQKMKYEDTYNLWTNLMIEYAEHFGCRSGPKKSMKLKEPSAKKETSEQRQKRTKSELSVLHQRYKTLNSQNLQKEFQETPELWHEYHTISEENEKSFPEVGIPRNKIIQELNEIKGKRTRTVVDMGCGKAQIADHFANDKRFTFINYDHISSKENVLVQDISNTGLEDDSVDICILCLAMWGSNCKDYIKESHRILESGGKLYIMEATKRWTTDGDEAGKRLKDLLEETGFQIVKSSVEKFCLFVCTKA